MWCISWGSGGDRGGWKGDVGPVGYKSKSDFKAGSGYRVGGKTWKIREFDRQNSRRCIYRNFILEHIGA